MHGRAGRPPTPETCGADIEVPVLSMYSAFGSARWAWSSSSPAAAEMTRSPGATRSGFIRPSPVGPLDEKNETPVVCGDDEVAPTVMARAALPGSLIVIAKPRRIVRPSGSLA